MVKGETLFTDSLVPFTEIKTTSNCGLMSYNCLHGQLVIGILASFISPSRGPNLTAPRAVPGPKLATLYLQDQ